MTPEDLRANAAKLRSTDVLAHLQRRGWEVVDLAGPRLWLLTHPDHELRQLLLPRDETDPSYVDAIRDILWRLSDIEEVSDVEILRGLMRPAQIFSVHEALEIAIEEAKLSPCAKSQRGAVLFSQSRGVLGRGHNAPPAPFVCDKSSECRAHCNKLAVHAEMAALHSARAADTSDETLEMVHVKAVAGAPVASGPPSCWQCSRELLAANIRWFWLLHEDGLRRYRAEDFHMITLRNCSLPVIR